MCLRMCSLANVESSRRLAEEVGEPNLDSRWTHKNMKSHAQTKQNCKIMGNQGGTLANTK